MKSKLSKNSIIQTVVAIYIDMWSTYSRQKRKIVLANVTLRIVKAMTIKKFN